MYKLNFLLLISVAVFLAACGKDTPQPEPPPVVLPEGVVFDIQDTTMAVGSVNLLVAKVLPADAADKTIEWKSSDPTVVSVNASGQIEALRVGTAVISASSKAAPGVRSSKKVIVQRDVDRVKGRIAFTPVGNGENLNLEFYLTNSSGKELVIIDYEVWYQSLIRFTHPWGTINESIPAQSAEKRVYDYNGVWTGFGGTLFQWEIRVFFKMDGRNYVLVTRPGSNGTEPVNEIVADIDLEWDGEYSGEIPQE